MYIVAVVNQKGGCGKTTTAIHLASRFAAMGRRTALIDLDPQGHATLGFGLATPGRDRSVAGVLATSGLDERVLALREVFVEVSDGLRVAPAGPELAELEPTLARAAGAEERLLEHLAPLAGDCDRVVLDAPPSLGLLTLNALAAAHEALVPVEPSLFSLHGLARLVELNALLADRSRQPTRLRVLVNAFDARTRFARGIREEIERTFPGQLLRTTIRASVRVREAALRGVPVERLSPRAPIAGDYAALARELESKLGESSDAFRREAVPGVLVERNGVYLSRKDVPPEQVRIAGDFNGWVPDRGVILDVRADGSWTKFVPLSPGHYEYKLLVGERWIADPLNPRRIRNAVGTSNSILEIRP